MIVTGLKSVIVGSVGGRTTNHKDAIIFEDTRFLICCSDTVLCLSIPDLTLPWRTQADQATCLEIFKYQDSYRVPGELEISRLDKAAKYCGIVEVQTFLSRLRGEVWTNQF